MAVPVEFISDEQVRLMGTSWGGPLKSSWNGSSSWTMPSKGSSAKVGGNAAARGYALQLGTARFYGYVPRRPASVLSHGMLGLMCETRSVEGMALRGRPMA